MQEFSVDIPPAFPPDHLPTTHQGTTTVQVKCSCGFNHLTNNVANAWHGDEAWDRGFERCHTYIVEVYKRHLRVEKLKAKMHEMGKGVVICERAHYPRHRCQVCDMLLNEWEAEMDLAEDRVAAMAPRTLDDKEPGS